MTKRFGFTLAEVLITLGIIGVVAAITMPTLIQNHRKNVHLTQLKSWYSEIGNAVSMYKAETGNDNLPTLPQSSESLGESNDFLDFLFHQIIQYFW